MIGCNFIYPFMHFLLWTSVVVNLFLPLPKILSVGMVATNKRTSKLPPFQLRTDDILLTRQTVRLGLKNNRKWNAVASHNSWNLAWRAHLVSSLWWWGSRILQCLYSSSRCCNCRFFFSWPNSDEPRLFSQNWMRSKSPALISMSSFFKILQSWWRSSLGQNEWNSVIVTETWR